MHYPQVITVLSTLSALVVSQPLQNVTSGLLLVQSRTTHPELTDQAFNDWYTNEHIRDMAKTGLTDLIIRYKNVNTSAPWPYLAVYRVPDVRYFTSKSTAGLTATSQLLPGKTPGSKGGDYKDVIQLNQRAFLRTQTYEGKSTDTSRAKGLVTALIEPAAGADQDFDDWYRKEHLGLLSDLKGYRRSTRYSSLDSKQIPRFLALHEFDTPAVPPEIRNVLATDWSKKILGAAKSAGNDVWSYVAEYSIPEAKTAF